MAAPPFPPRDDVKSTQEVIRWRSDLWQWLKSNGGGGTITEIDTAAPITGGPITTTGTIGVSTLVGDSGAGGASGVVPAPAAGDAAAGKFLKADGSWAAPAGGSATRNAAMWARI